jgi:hypothetical protein
LLLLLLLLITVDVAFPFRTRNLALCSAVSGPITQGNGESEVINEASVNT